MPSTHEQVSDTSSHDRRASSTMTAGERFTWPPGHTSAAALSFDVDGECAVLSQDPAAASRWGVMSHQAYGPTIGVPRILRLLAHHDVRATFFVPGYTARRYPDTVRAIVDAGHEVGHHGYMHEHVRGVSRDVERSILLRGLEALEEVAKVRPIGYRAPGAELNYRSPELLADEGFLYDSSLMDDDTPYVIATTPQKDGKTLIEIPIHWGLDDWEQYAFLPGLEGSGVIESPAKALEMWSLELTAMAAENGCFVLTAHPEMSGRPSRAAALGELIEHARSVGGVWLTTLGDIATYAASLDLPPRYYSQPQVPDDPARPGPSSGAEIRG
jgi:peptidoglycan/xylan/chitin deacetylase (PgdA/CDA1 family)